MVDHQMRTDISHKLPGLLCGLLIAVLLAVGCGDGGQNHDMTTGPNAPTPVGIDQVQTPAGHSLWCPAPDFLAVSKSPLASAADRGPASLFRETLPEEAFHPPSEQVTKQVLADLHERLAIELELEQGLSTTLPVTEAELGRMPVGASP